MEARGKSWLNQDMTQKSFSCEKLSRMVYQRVQIENYSKKTKICNF